jgi:hypothetical protein
VVAGAATAVVAGAVARVTVVAAAAGSAAGLTTEVLWAEMISPTSLEFISRSSQEFAVKIAALTLVVELPFRMATN